MAVGNSRVVSDSRECSVLRLRVLEPGRKRGIRSICSTWRIETGFRELGSIQESAGSEPCDLSNFFTHRIWGSVGIFWAEKKGGVQKSKCLDLTNTSFYFAL